MIVFSLWPTLNIFLVIPGLAILVFNGIWVSLLLGLLCARFRDIFQIIISFLQVMFFITPIIWLPDHKPALHLFLVLNPFYHFLHIVRAPLLGQMPDLISWMAVIGITILGWGVTLICFHNYRKRVPYWV